MNGHAPSNTRARPAPATRRAPAAEQSQAAARAAMAAPAGQASSRLELSIQCAKLADADFSSKSDPCCLLYSRRSPIQAWELVGKTETCKNNLDPVFTTPIVTDYYFEEVQYLKFELLDVDSIDGSGNVKGDLLGTMECRLSEIVGARGCTLVRTLASKRSKKSGIKVMAEEASAVKGSVLLSLRGTKLANRDGWFGTSDPFYVLSKAREDGVYVPCAKSNVVDNNLNPVWQPLRVPLQRLCNGDLARPLRLDVNDFDKDDKFEEIGHLSVTTGELLTPGWTGQLKHPRGKDKSVGTVTVAASQLQPEPSFMDYMAAGLELSLVVAVDFTASNGHPNDPDSLHYASSDPARPNPYEAAITSVGAVLAPYDLDGMFQCYGFGGHMPGGQVSHCFALNGQPAAAACAGVPGIMAAYRQALQVVALSGPTCFAPVINAACDLAQQTLRDPPCAPLKYFFLLIITDGAIMDMDQTVNAVVRASRLPLSLIIVGVGAADFGSMVKLDADNGPLRGSAGAAARDCVQFVRMNDYSGLGAGARLARDVLAEAPAQVVQFFMGTGRPPGPPQAKPQGLDPSQY